MGARPGKPRLPWSWRHWNGSRGSTTNACSNPTATFRPLRPKRDTIGNLQRRLWNLFYFNQKASAIPGAIHNAFLQFLFVLGLQLRAQGMTVGFVLFVERALYLGQHVVALGFQYCLESFHR